MSDELTLQELPSGWSRVHIADVATERRRRPQPGTQLEVYSVTKHDGIVKSLDYFDRQVFSRDTSNYNLVLRDNLAYATIHLDEGSLGILRDPEAGLISPMYTVMEVVTERIVPEYLYQVMKQPWMISQYQRIGQGSIDRRKSISFDRLANLTVPLPSLAYQRRILEQLRAIDAAIEKTEAVIDGTEKLRSALLEDLLTRGVPGWHTEWKQVTGVGRVPANWASARLDAVADVQTGRAVGKPETGSRLTKLPYLSVANVKDGYLDLSLVKTMMVSSTDIVRFSLQTGDVLFTEGGDADKLGRGCVWRGEIEVCLHQNHIFAVRPKKDALRSEFLAAYARSRKGKAYFLSCAKQTTNLASINSTQLKTFPLPVPSLSEQDRILSILSSIPLSAPYLGALNATKVAAADALLIGRAPIMPTSFHDQVIQTPVRVPAYERREGPGDNP